MAQPGITSALGLCIESTFRQVPITLASGANYNVGIAGANPHRFFTTEPGAGFTGKPTIVTPDNEIDGDSQLSREILTGKTYDGGIDFKADAENLYYPLLAVFGRDIQTILNASGSNASPAVAQHIFLPSKTYVPSFTCEEQFGDGNYGRLSSGVVMKSLEIDCADILMAKLTGIPHRDVPNTYPNAAGANTKYKFGSSTANLLPSQMGGDGTKTITRTPNPIYVDVPQGNSGNGPFVYGAMTFGTVGGQFAGAFLTVNGVAVTNVEILPGLKFTFERQMVSQMIGGSGLDPGAVTPGAFMVGGSIGLNFKDDQIQSAGMGFDDLGINIRFPGVVIGPGGQTYGLEIYIPRFKLLTVPVNPGDGPIIIQSEWKARRDPALGYVAKVTLVNTVDNSLLSGVAGTTGAAGGCGGWSNQ